MIYHELDISGPLLRHADGRVDQSRDVVIRGGTQSLMRDLCEAMPDGADDRTPLRYAPVEATLTRYHGLTPEDLRKTFLGNNQTGDDNDADAMYVPLFGQQTALASVQRVLNGKSTTSLPQRQYRPTVFYVTGTAAVGKQSLAFYLLERICRLFICQWLACGSTSW